MYCSFLGETGGRANSGGIFGRENIVAVTAEEKEGEVDLLAPQVLPILPPPFFSPLFRLSVMIEGYKKWKEELLL